MQETEIVPFILIIANGLFSWQGFKNRRLFSRYCFQVGDIQFLGQYDRLISSAFLHADIPHLAFNMLALYSFATGLVSALGTPRFLLLYFAALLGGNLLSLLMHRKDPNYTAVGASGAVSGVIFAGILLFPESKIMLLFLPIPFPGWIFGVAYIAFSIFGMKRKLGNLGHDAHLGGALAGILLTTLFAPAILRARPLLFLALTAPPLLFLGYELISNHQDRPKREKKQKPPVSATEQAWMDRILEKISREGIGKISAAEKRKMHRIAQKKQQGDT